MAIIKMIQNSNQTIGGLKNIIGYVVKKEKTELENGPILVSGVNCNPRFAYKDFMLTKKSFHKEDGRMFYHCLQSFNPNEKVSPEEVHQIGLELANYFAGYEIVVGTHTEKEHLHNHLIINSVNRKTGKKLHFTKNDLENLMNYSDKLCKEHGLTTLNAYQKSSVKGMSHGEYSTAVNKSSWKFRLINEIENAMKICHTKNEFIFYMERKGYKVNWTDNRKNICYTTPNDVKCRDCRLHEEKFLKENMENEFRLREIKEAEPRESADGYRADFLSDGNVKSKAGHDNESTRRSDRQNNISTEDENGIGDRQNIRTGWEDSRKDLYGLGRKNEKDIHKSFSDCGDNNHQPRINNGIGKGVLSIVKSLSRVDCNHDEDTTLALSVVTGLSAAAIVILLEIMKSKSENELTEDFIEETVSELREQEQAEDFGNEDQDFGNMKL